MNDELPQILYLILAIVICMMIAIFVREYRSPAPRERHHRRSHRRRADRILQVARITPEFATRGERPRPPSPSAAIPPRRRAPGDQPASPRHSELERQYS